MEVGSEADGKGPEQPGELCPGCGRRFECGMKAGRDSCWCAALPPLASPLPGVGCYCPDCLARRLKDAASTPGP